MRPNCRSRRFVPHPFQCSWQKRLPPERRRQRSRARCRGSSRSSFERTSLEGSPASRTSIPLRRVPLELKCISFFHPFPDLDELTSVLFQIVFTLYSVVRNVRQSRRIPE